MLAWTGRNVAAIVAEIATLDDIIRSRDRDTGHRAVSDRESLEANVGECPGLIALSAKLLNASKAPNRIIQNHG
jgi:hypothetical protein